MRGKTEKLAGNYLMVFRPSNSLFVLRNAIIYLIRDRVVCRHTYSGRRGQTQSLE